MLIAEHGDSFHGTSVQDDVQKCKAAERKQKHGRNAKLHRQLGTDELHSGSPLAAAPNKTWANALRPWFDGARQQPPGESKPPQPRGTKYQINISELA